jgi:hypothetical protein
VVSHLGERVLGSWCGGLLTMIDDIVGHENDLMFCSRTGLEVGGADREP